MYSNLNNRKSTQSSPFYDRSQTSSYANYREILFNPARALQNSELNEMQSIINEYLKSVSNLSYVNGSILYGLTPSYSSSTTFTLTPGLVYWDGSVFAVDTSADTIALSSLTYTNEMANIYLIAEYQRWTAGTISGSDDPTLYDPSVTGYNLPGADRLLVTFTQTLSITAYTGSQYMEVLSIQRIDTDGAGTYIYEISLKNRKYKITDLFDSIVPDKATKTKGLDVLPFRSLDDMLKERLDMAYTISFTEDSLDSSDKQYVMVKNGVGELDENLIVNGHTKILSFDKKEIATCESTDDLTLKINCPGNYNNEVGVYLDVVNSLSVAEAGLSFYGPANQYSLYGEFQNPMIDQIIEFATTTTVSQTKWKIGTPVYDAVRQYGVVKDFYFGVDGFGVVEKAIARVRLYKENDANGDSSVIIPLFATVSVSSTQYTLSNTAIVTSNTLSLSSFQLAENAIPGRVCDIFIKYWNKDYASWYTQLFCRAAISHVVNDYTLLDYSQRPIKEKNRIFFHGFSGFAETDYDATDAAGNILIAEGTQLDFSHLIGQAHQGNSKNTYSFAVKVYDGTESMPLMDFRDEYDTQVKHTFKVFPYVGSEDFAKVIYQNANDTANSWPTSLNIRIGKLDLPYLNTISTSTYITNREITKTPDTTLFNGSLPAYMTSRLWRYCDFTALDAAYKVNNISWRRNITVGGTDYNVMINLPRMSAFKVGNGSSNVQNIFDEPNSGAVITQVAWPAWPQKLSQVVIIKIPVTSADNSISTISVGDFLVSATIGLSHIYEGQHVMQFDQYTYTDTFGTCSVATFSYLNMDNAEFYHIMGTTTIHRSIGQVIDVVTGAGYRTIALAMCDISSGNNVNDSRTLDNGFAGIPAARNIYNSVTDFFSYPDAALYRFAPDREVVLYDNVGTAEQEYIKITPAMVAAGMAIATVGLSEAGVDTIQFKRGFTAYAKTTATVSGSVFSKVDIVIPGHPVFPSLCPTLNALVDTISTTPRCKALDGIGAVYVSCLKEVTATPCNHLFPIQYTTEDIYGTVSITTDTLNKSAYAEVATKLNTTALITINDYFVGDVNYGYRCLDDIAIEASNSSSNISSIQFNSKGWIKFNYRAYLPDIVHLYMNNNNELKYTIPGASLSTQLKEPMLNGLYLGTTDIPPVGFMHDMNVINSLNDTLKDYFKKYDIQNSADLAELYAKHLSDFNVMKRDGGKCQLIDNAPPSQMAPSGIVWGMRIPIVIDSINMTQYEGNFAKMNVGDPVFAIRRTTGQNGMDWYRYLGKVKSKASTSFGTKDRYKIAITAEAGGNIPAYYPAVANSISLEFLARDPGAYTPSHEWVDYIATVDIRSAMTISYAGTISLTQSTTTTLSSTTAFNIIGRPYTLAEALAKPADAVFPTAYTWYYTVAFADTMDVTSHNMINDGFCDMSKLVDATELYDLNHTIGIDIESDSKNRLYIDTDTFTIDPINKEMTAPYIYTISLSGDLVNYFTQTGAALQKYSMHGQKDYYDSIVAIKRNIDGIGQSVKRMIVDTGDETIYSDTIDFAVSRETYPRLYLKDFSLAHQAMNYIKKFNDPTIYLDTIYDNGFNFNYSVNSISYAWARISNADDGIVKYTFRNNNLKFSIPAEDNVNRNTNLVMYTSNSADQREFELYSTQISYDRDVLINLGFNYNEFDGSTTLYTTSDPILDLNVIVGDNKANRLMQAYTLADALEASDVKPAIVPTTLSHAIAPMYQVFDIKSNMLEFTEYENGIYPVGVRTTYQYDVQGGTALVASDVVTKVKLTDAINKRSDYDYISDAIVNPLMFRNSFYELGKEFIPINLAQVYRFDEPQMVYTIVINLGYEDKSATDMKEPIAVHFGYCINGEIDINGLVHTEIVYPDYTATVMTISLPQPICIPADVDFYIGFQHVIDTISKQRVLFNVIDNGGYAATTDPNMVSMSACANTKLWDKGSFDYTKMLKIDLIGYSHLMEQDIDGVTDDMFELSTGTISLAAATISKVLPIIDSVTPEGTTIEYLFYTKIAQANSGEETYVWKQIRANEEISLKFPQNKIGFTIRLKTTDRNVTPIVKTSSIHFDGKKQIKASLGAQTELIPAANELAFNGTTFSMKSKTLTGTIGHIYYKHNDINYNVFDSNWAHYNLLECNGCKLPLDFYTLKLGFDFFDPNFDTTSASQPDKVDFAVKAKYFTDAYTSNGVLGGLGATRWCSVLPLFAHWHSNGTQCNPMGIGFNMSKLQNGWWRQTLEFIPMIHVYTASDSQFLFQPTSDYYVYPVIPSLWTFRFDISMQNVNERCIRIKNISSNMNRLKTESSTDLPLFLFGDPTINPKAITFMYPNIISQNVAQM